MLLVNSEVRGFVLRHGPFDMGLVTRKPVFGASDKARLKPVSSATETSYMYKLEISLVESLDIIHCYKRVTMALIKLRGCESWSASLLFTNSGRQVFSRRGPFDKLKLQHFSTKWASSRENLSSGVCDKARLKPVSTATETS